MKKMLLLGLAVALASAAFAYPTLTGPTGLISVPTAAVAPAGQIDLAADYYNTEVNNTYPIRVLYGAMENLEVGGAYVINDASNAWDLNVKYVTPLNLAGFGIAAGALYAQTDSSPKATVEQLSLVGSRGLMEGDGTMPALGVTIGTNWTNMKEGGAKMSKFRGLLGFDATFANNLTVVAELTTKAKGIDAKMPWGVAVRYPFMENLSGQVGYTNAGLGGSTEKSRLFAGVSYGYGLK